MTDTADFFVSFSHPAVIFEDAYDNSPTEHVNRRSTTTLLTIHAEGGSHGGMFTLTRLEGLGKLCLQGGGAVSPRMSDTVAPGQSYVRSYLCEGCVASGKENDVVVEGTFYEAGTQNRLRSSGTLKVVSIAFQPDDAIGDCHFRHEVGVGERIRFVSDPQGVDVGLNVNPFTVEYALGQTYMRLRA